MKKFDTSYLTVFSEGEGSEAEADAETEVKSAPESEAETTLSDDEEFDRLIKGRFKDAYTRRTQNMINRRFKETKELEEYKASTEKILKERDGVRRADAALGAAREYRRILGEAEELKEIYPSFDLEAECREPKFTSLIAAGIGVKGAYEALHHDEIVSGAMQYAADRVYKAARGGFADSDGRPTENGAAGSVASPPRVDVASMTEGDIRRILKRVQSGEKIRF